MEEWMRENTPRVESSWEASSWAIDKLSCLDWVFYIVTQCLNIRAIPRRKLGLIFGNQDQHVI